MMSKVYRSSVYHQISSEIQTDITGDEGKIGKNIFFYLIKNMTVCHSIQDCHALQ